MKTPVRKTKQTSRNLNFRKGAEERYILQLFVAGISPNSIRAIENINSICDKYLTGKYELEIIDIHQQPQLAIEADILAIPALIKKFPLPEERMIGDLSDVESVLAGLHLKINI